MRQGGASLGWPGKGHARWVQAGESLRARQYDQAAELLHEAQTASEQSGDVILAHVLAETCQICLACSQCRAQVQWYQQAYQEANQREQELRQRLHAILELASGQALPEMPARREEPPSPSTSGTPLPEYSPPEPVKSPSMWQHIQRWLRRSPPHSSGQVLPASTAEGAEQDPPLLVVSILKYLAAHRGTPIVKDILMDLFWPDADPEAARRNLHQATYSLRQTLRRGYADFPYIQFENDHYLLNPEVGIWLDSEEFEKHAQAGRRLEAAGRLSEAMAQYGSAESLYQGHFLEEDLYEDWPMAQRERIRRMYCDLADRLSEHYLQQGDTNAAIVLCQKVLPQDNCHEEAHRRLMRCYKAQGQRHLAVRQYQTCVEVLREELDLAPSEETVALYQRITTAT